MSQPNAKEVPLLPLLENCSFADSVHEPQPYPLLGEDLKGLIEVSKGFSIQCDRDVHRLHVVSGKGGFRKGNLCYVDGFLFGEGMDEPAAHIHIDFDKDYKLFINLRSKVSRFRWSYRSDESETKSRNGATSTRESAKSGGCFVATAAYGSPLAPQVLVFQRFRDEVLLTSTLGSLLVEVYYFLSPPLALLISRIDILKRITRHLLLTPILLMLRIGNKH